MTTTSNSKTVPVSEELPRLEEITIAQSGKKFLEDQVMMETMLEQLSDYRKRNEKLQAEIDRLNQNALEYSIAFSDCKNHIKKLVDSGNQARSMLQTSNMHLYKMLDEHEGAFDNDEKFESCEICIDYIDAAMYCEKYFGREANRVTQAKEWLDSQPTEKRTDKI